MSTAHEADFVLSELASVTHDGKVVVVGSGADGVLRYTIRQSGFEDSAVSPLVADAPPGFEEWQSVPLDRATRDRSVESAERATMVDRTGRPIMRSIYGEHAAESATGRVALLSGLGHLYLFRVSASSSRLLMSRFVLDGMTNELVPKLEVRFRRSGQRLEPEGGTAGTGAVELDTLAYRDTAHKPFFEPAKELSFLGDFDLDKPWFSVELMPTGEHEKFRWNFFVFTGGELRLISLAASPDGLFEPRDQRKTRVDSDQVDRRVTTTVPGLIVRTIVLPGPPVAAFDSSTYHNQVARMTKAGEELLKDSTRVMLSVPIQRPSDSKPTVAALSFTVGQLGLLAQVDRTGTEQLLVGKAKEVLLPLTDLEEIKLIADRTPPPAGDVIELGESPSGTVRVSSGTGNDSDEDNDGGGGGGTSTGPEIAPGDDVKIWGTQTFDGTYVARNVDEQAGTFELDTAIDMTGQGHWEVVDDDSGQTFENMVVGYEPIGEGRLKVTCTSHNLSDGDEIRLEGTTNHDGVFQVTGVDAEENSFVIDKPWPAGEVVNFSIRHRRGLVFDGRGDHLRAGPVELDAHVVDQRLQRTVSAWISLDDITGHRQVIFEADSNLIVLLVDEDGHLRAEVGFADGYAAAVVEPEPLPIGQWVHVTAMVDYEGDSVGKTTIRLLRDGTETAAEVVEPLKPIHLPQRNLHLSQAALPMTTVRYDTAETRSLTIEAWVLPLGSGRAVVASWQQRGSFELALVGNAGKQRVEWTTNGDPLTGTTVLEAGRWHHIAATYNPRTSRRTITVDGDPDVAGTTDATSGVFVSVKDAAELQRPLVVGALGAGFSNDQATAAEVAAFSIPTGGWKQTGPKTWIEVDAEGAQVGPEYDEENRTFESVRLRRGREKFVARFTGPEGIIIERSRPISMTLPWGENPDRSVGEIVEFEWHVDPNTEITSVERFSRIDQSYWELSRSNGRVEAYEEYHRSGKSIWLRPSHTVDPMGEPSRLSETWAQVNFDRDVFMLEDRDTGTVQNVRYAEAGEVATETLDRVTASPDHEFVLEDPTRRRWVEKLNGETIRQFLETAAADTAENASGTAGGEMSDTSEHAERPTTLTLRAFDPPQDSDYRISFDVAARTWTSDGPVLQAFMGVDAIGLMPSPRTEDRYQGAIADVRVWGAVRSQADIQANMATALTGAEANLVAFWPLGETAANRSGDLTVNKIHLDLSELETPESVLAYTRDLTPVVAKLLADPLEGTDGKQAVLEAVEMLAIGERANPLFVMPADSAIDAVFQSLALQLRAMRGGQRMLVLDGDALTKGANQSQVHDRFETLMAEIETVDNVVLAIPNLYRWTWAIDASRMAAAMDSGRLVTVTTMDGELLEDRFRVEFPEIFNRVYPIEVRDLPDVVEPEATTDLTPASEVEIGPWYSTPHRAPGRIEHYKADRFEETYWIAADPDIRPKHVLQLDGIGGHLKVPDFDHEAADGYTVAFWAKWDALNPYSFVVDLGAATGDGADPDQRLRIGTLVDNTLRFHDAGQELTTEITVDTWHHVAATLSDQGAATLYLDGQPVAAGTFEPPTAVRRTNNFIGRTVEAETMNFAGAVRDVQLWDRALDEADVRRFMVAMPEAGAPGLSHHWNMATKETSRQTQVLDQGEGRAAHATVRSGATVTEIDSSQAGGPGVTQEFKGKLSEVEIWTVNPTLDEIKQRRHLQLQGNEYGLAHNWRCGGIVADADPGSESRRTPDMGTDALDAVVVGDVYMSARDLARRNSAGVAVRFTNDDLVAVTQGASYRETFEFRAVSSTGEPWSLDDLNDADGTQRRIFHFRYWGKKSKTSDERIDLQPDAVSERDFEVVDAALGWFRASARFTVPNDVNLIRCFDIDQVRSLSDGDDIPEDDWAALSVRRHRIELVSDAITRVAYTDDLKHLALLDDNGDALARAVVDLPVLERRQARYQAEIADIAERLKWFKLKDALRRRRVGVEADIARRARELTAARLRASNYRNDPFNYHLSLGSRTAGTWLTVNGDRITLDGKRESEGAVLEVEEASGGGKRLRLVESGRLLAVRDRTETVTHSRTERFIGFLWETETVRWTTEKKIDNEVYLTDSSDGDVWQLHGHAGHWRLINQQHEVALTDMGTLCRSMGFSFAVDGVWGLQWKDLAGQEWRFHQRSTMPERTKNRLAALVRAVSSKNTRLRASRAELRWIDQVLNMNADDESALRTRQTELQTQLNDVDSRIRYIHSQYGSFEAATGSTTMELVAEDQRGLTTYGSILSFASPATGISTAAVAEGNVQLGYFDVAGRMRLTNYDATSDSTNASFEEWLGTAPARSVEIHNRDGRLKLIDNEGEPAPVSLPAAGHTVEAWFYYPPPVQSAAETSSGTGNGTAGGQGGASAGRPYPLTFLTSDEDGSEAALAIAAGRRLGTVVDGFFHDAGVDLKSHLDRGWHHVAARTDNGAVAFFLDGEGIGAQPESTSPPAQARMIDQTNEGLRVVARDLAVTGDFTFQTWFRCDSAGSGGRSLFRLWFGSSDVRVDERAPGEIDVRLQAGGQTTGTSAPHRPGQWHNLAITVANGMLTVYLDGTELQRRVVEDTDLRNAAFYLGHANEGDLPFEVSTTKLWRRALASSEIAEQMFEAPSIDDTDLAGHWSMSTIEVSGRMMVRNLVNVVKDAPAGHLTIGGSIPRPSRPLPSSISKPIAVLGNAANNDGPAGRLAHLRFWSQPLRDEEIRANSLIELTGNEPDLVAGFTLERFAQDQSLSLTGDRRVRLDRGRIVPRSAAIGHPGVRVADFGDGASLTLPDVQTGGEFTVEFWARSADDRLKQVMKYGTGNETLYIGLHSTGVQVKKGWFGIGAAAGGQTTDAWHHVAATVNSLTNTVAVYLDGEYRRESTSFPAGAILAGPLILGLAQSNQASSAIPTAGVQLAEFRLWSGTRSADQIAENYDRRLAAASDQPLVHLPLDERFAIDDVVNRVDGQPVQVSAGDQPRSVRVDDLPIVPSAGLVTAEYNTVGPNPEQPSARRAMLRRFYGFVDDVGRASLLPGKRIEELVLKWIGNAQFEPTLLGYIEGAPPVPSENLTVDMDYDGATTVELSMTDEVEYTWNRSTDIGGGLDINAFIGGAWGVSAGIGVESKVSEGHLGVRGSARTEWRRQADSRISARSTTTSRDELELRGSFEIEPKFPHLGNRYVPKNVGYALVVSGMADVFITQMKRSGRMVGYEVQPAEDMPPDVNTITFLINPAYTLNGSLDGLVGSHAADEQFYRHVPQMRAEHGSRYPASYYNLKQAYDLKRGIERWDKERESYFAAFESEKVMGLDEGLLDQIPAVGDESGGGLGMPTDDASSSPVAEGDTRSDSERAEEDKERLRKKYEENMEEQEEAVNKRTDDIERRFADKDKQEEARSAFKAWQRKMEGIQLRAAKRNIQNTYVWDADGGIHYEEEDFANTIEHTVGGSFNLDASLGADLNAQVSHVKGELQALATLSMSQTMSKSRSSTQSFELNVRLDRVERKGVTDADDYPIHPGEKVDRYRFMSFYLEGDTDHFSDFFNEVVDPEWLMSNDEEARALRQVARGKPNKAWRVMHRVTFVERPALMGFGRDMRLDETLEQASQEVYSYLHSLERDNEELRGQISSVHAELEKISGMLHGLSSTAGGSGPAPNPTPNPTPNSAPSPSPSPSPSGGLIDLRDSAVVALNEAGQKQLEALVGVGPSLARAILNRRRARGAFASIDDLVEISGIGPVLVEELRDQLEANDG